MTEYQRELIGKMIVKINEAKGYSRIQTILSLIWLVEFFLTFFSYSKVDLFYWIILVICVIGWFDLNKRSKKSLEEYEELKERYMKFFGDEDI